jgi:hypothetical protein
MSNRENNSDETYDALQLSLNENKISNASSWVSYLVPGCAL